VKPYQHLIKHILLLFLIDGIVLAVFIWWINATPDVSIAELLILLVIIVINIVIALILYYWLRNSGLSAAFAINMVISPVLFHYMFKAWFIHYDEVHFERYYFKSSGKQYEITLDKQYHAFILSDISNQQNGSTTGLIMGDYTMLADSIVLKDSVKRMVIINNRLKGYPKADDVIVLKEINE
jgi:phosphoglycerol transferase MdoB-like AlkP superfamily enzyme